MSKRSGRSKRAVIYLRVGESSCNPWQAVTRQREECLRIAKQRGLEVVREYADIGRPARLEQQDELKRLLDDLYWKGDAGFVIVAGYSRLAWWAPQLELVERRLRSCRAEIATTVGVEVIEQRVHEWLGGMCEHE